MSCRAGGWAQEWHMFQCGVFLSSGNYSLWVGGQEVGQKLRMKEEEQRKRATRSFFMVCHVTLDQGLLHPLSMQFCVLIITWLELGLSSLTLFLCSLRLLQSQFSMAAIKMTSLYFPSASFSLKNTFPFTISFFNYSNLWQVNYCKSWQEQKLGKHEMIFLLSLGK